MFDEIKALLAGAIKAVRERIERAEQRVDDIEDHLGPEVAALRQDVAELRRGFDALGSGDLASIKAEVDALGGTSGAAGSVSAGQPSAPVATAPTPGTTVTVDAEAGTTTHVDAATGIATTVDHATGQASAATVDGGIPVAPAPAAIAAAARAAADAGVQVGGAVAA